MLSGCQTLQSVDRGLYNIAESVSEQDRVTGQRSLSLQSRAQQIQQGNSVVEQLIAKEKKDGRKLNQQLDKDQYWRMVQIFDRVHRISHLSDERWQPILIDRDSFNAFTTGGTYIVVHRGLMEQLTSDDEVAAVMAHEIAHTVANHVFEAQSLAQVTALANSGSAGRDGYRAAFTQKNEYEADRIGVLYSSLAGYDPLASSRIWKRQYQTEGNRRGLFFQSHPVNSDRERFNRVNGEKVQPYYTPGRINPNHAQLLQNNSLWSKQQQGSDNVGQGGGFSALAGTLLGAYVDHQQAKAGERQQQQQIRFVRYVQSQMKLVGETRPSADRWQLRFRYDGQIPLQGVTVGGQLSQGKDKAPIVMVAHVKQAIRQGEQFKAEFRHTALKSLSKPSDSIKLYLDDAVPQ
ncbi:M48 family metallopeptidase [Motiliproteus coralliicola]|uniref:M48 family metallopeptidase n=1 Tax=Motiliproteus coralliicola TaxID=2283196 RepID=UPI001403FA57|nr:M48 family metallopeptidase [Motiliproteus coralliicola]